MRCQSCLITIAIVCFSTITPAANFELLEQNGDVEVQLDGKLFTRYLTSGPRPILWPLVGPTGVEMTRSYPMDQSASPEMTDHPHHRSLWFSHGDVNGLDFWTEPSDKNQRKHGSVVHREFLRIESGEEPLIVTRNEWVNSEGEKILTDYRHISFGAGEDFRWVDFDIRLVADGDQAVKFGDTKEGTFAVRVAPWLSVDAEQGGEIINSVGQTDKETWGQQTSWVDYHGSHEGQELGIAILNHPGSFRFPTYWHVRTYGLFAANVFGLHNFKNSDEVDGSVELQPGESLLFCYRVLLHIGDEQAGRVPESFVNYAKIDKSRLTLDDSVSPAATGLEPASGEAP